MDTQYVPVNSGDNFLGSGGIGALLIGALLFGGGFGYNRNGMNGGYVPGAIEGAQSGAISGLQAQVNGIANQIGQNQIDSSINGLSNYIAQSTISTNQAIDANARQTIQEFGNISSQLASGNFTTLQSLNSTLAAITAQNNQNALSTLNSFNGINTNMLQGFNQQNLQILNGFNQVGAALASIQNNADKCCCEIKQAINADGAATRALINDLNVQNLQTQLADAKNQISDLNQTNILINNNALQTNTILQHLRPFPTVA